jgi:predicted phosphodiesterase
VRYLVLADLHANLQALDAVLADAATRGYDQVLVLGDLVGYGADPAAVIDRTLGLDPAAIIRGNHDKVCAGLESPEYFNEVARQSIEWTAAALSPAHLAALAALPRGPRLVTDAVEICHGAPFDEDYYVFDLADASAAIDAASARLCLFGHTHVPAVFSTPGDPMQPRGPTDDELVLPDEGPALVNVGSVGQPRDGDPRAAYGVLDLEARTLKLCRVAYDVAGAQARIRAAGLPDRLALRLSKGQ